MSLQALCLAAITPNRFGGTGSTMIGVLTDGIHTYPWLAYKGQRYNGEDVRAMIKEFVWLYSFDRSMAPRNAGLSFPLCSKAFPENSPEPVVTIAIQAPMTPRSKKKGYWLFAAAKGKTKSLWLPVDDESKARARVVNLAIELMGRELTIIGGADTSWYRAVDTTRKH